MRIAFDATTLRPPQTGIGYYTGHLLRHLVQEDPSCEFVLVSNRSVESSLPLPDGVAVAESRRFPLRSVWLQAMAPALLRQIQPDVAHFTNSIIPLRKSCPTVVTIHDMSLTLFPRLHPLRRVLTRSLVLRSARSADAVIAVSDSARRDILRLTGLARQKVAVIHEAAAPDFRPIEDQSALDRVRRRYDLPQPFILFVGTLEPRKNLPALIAAFGELKRSGKISHALVLAGPPGWGFRQVRRAIGEENLESDVKILGYVPYADLPALYNLAQIFVFPSLHEGFGLPVVEAMACGTPVAASDNSSLREVAGEAAERMDAEDSLSLRKALDRILLDADRRAELSALGLERSKRFSWSRAAAETLEVYRRAAVGPIGGADHRSWR